MNHHARLALAALLAGCSPGEHLDGGATEEAPSAWIEVATTSFLADGESGTVTIPAPGPLAALALRATAGPGVCFQLSSLVDGEGRAVIEGRSAGPYCRGCALRASVAVEAGVFLLPRATGSFQPETGLSLRFARVDCRTLTPLNTPEDRPTLQLAVQPILVIPEQATLALRLHIAGDSILSGDEERQQELLAALANELAPAGFHPRLIETLEIDAPPGDLHVQAGDHTALAAWIAASPRRGGALDVYVGGCLLLDGLVGPPAVIKGFTPRIPGGAGPADGVFLPGLDCFAKNSGPDDTPVQAQARVLAHEIGHYLGLYHTVETDGGTDQLDDTDQASVMHPNPALVTSVGFSPSQGRAMRMHPAARAF